jgi:CDGSH-type Zn-finger protein
MKTLLTLVAAMLLCSCGTTSFKAYDRTKITKGFTQTEDALADARKYTQDAKDEVRRIKKSSKLIDNKAGVILKYWDKAK